MKKLYMVAMCIFCLTAMEEKTKECISHEETIALLKDVPGVHSFAQQLAQRTDRKPGTIERSTAHVMIQADLAEQKLAIYKMKFPQIKDTEPFISLSIQDFCSLVKSFEK